MRILLALLLLLATARTEASVTEIGTTFTLTPAMPQSGEAIAVHLDSDTGCTWAVGSSVQVGVIERVVALRFWSTDTTVTPCPTYATTPRTHPVGALPRGTWRVDFEICSGNPPPGAPACAVFASEVLIVGGGDVLAVPLRSFESASILVAVVWAVALATRRRSRYGSTR